MKIEVTKHDIDNGIQNKCQLCPIALAVKRKINGEVIVFGVPCCKFCNFAKNDSSHKNFVDWIERLVIFNS
jgi:hypothetical protein